MGSLSWIWHFLSPLLFFPSQTKVVLLLSCSVSPSGVRPCARFRLGLGRFPLRAWSVREQAAALLQQTQPRGEGLCLRFVCGGRELSD